jgi:Phage tail sheath protein subtilisin-like domain/Phage tail sheath C-terminal domain
MATLVSPGVSVSVTDSSFFIPATAPTVPLFFIATKSGKTQPTGAPAVGTLESGVVRTVTSLAQSIQLFGIPSFRNDIAENEFHGDCRNEYGLFALNQYLGVGNRAYVVRADVDLSDEPVSFKSVGVPVLDTASITAVNNIGNGTVASVVIGSDQFMHTPRDFQITFTSANVFRVSVDGAQLGVGDLSASPDFNVGGVTIQMQQGAVPFSPGDSFTFKTVSRITSVSPNVGNGFVQISDLGIATNGLKTISFTSPTQFNFGSLSGTVGQPFVEPSTGVEFVVTQGTSPFAAGDIIDFTVSTVSIPSTLGVSDAAKRVTIVQKLQAAINSNTEIRSKIYEYNIILCPGYHEVVDEMLALSTAVKDEAFVIADTPCNKTPEQIAVWAKTSERFNSTSVAYYYPWALASNLDGRNVLAAPSGVALRTIAYSDNAAYVWIAPAGISRGVITGVSKVGYVSGTLGTATTFIETNLTDGQIDLLYEYDTNINPFVFFPGRGLLVWGQKTSAPAASARDRINVERMIMMVRRDLRKGAMPFVFEPNDPITRDNLKAMADNRLNDILVKRGLIDYATKSDESNNTPDRIDRNELWLDVALKPTKASEYIYIPINVVNTGADI